MVTTANSASKPLPPLLAFGDGRRVTTPTDWDRRRAEILAQLQELAYGHLPPAPERVTGECLHPYTLSQDRRIHAANYRLTCEPTGFSFNLLLVTPPGTGPFPVVIDGDGCWRYLTDEILVATAHRGYAVAQFSRVDIVPDNYSSARDSGLYRVYPQGDYGALAAWAWGYHRVADFVQGLPEIDASRLIATGHSRGGKTALLAGATDPRFALTAPNNSGCGGAGCFRYPDEGGEKLEDILRAVPYWFSSRLREFIGRTDELPFDQHFLKALVAPRALLTTEALGDHWASPRGTRLTHEAARELYQFLGAAQRLGLWYREGGHAHSPADWEALLDFADHQLYSKPAVRDFDMNPWKETRP